MNSLSLAISALRARPLSSTLCVIATGMGIAMVCAVFLITMTLADGFSRNARGIDIVVGAKSSPLQLVLSTIYHADIAGGNIDMHDYETLRRHPQVRSAIPLAIGDNYHGWRVVGTTADYLGLYHAQFAKGSVFQKPFDIVAGAATGLQIGDQFAAAHGFAADSDDVHDFHLYTVSGVLKPSGSVLDRLLVTSFESVQQLHSHPNADDPDAAEEKELGHQITAVLLTMRGPAAVMNFPRQINQTTTMLAASPSFEMMRLSRSIGMGRVVLISIAAGFVVLSAMMLFSSLSATLALRRYDLAVLRVLGASPRMLATTVIAEGGMIGLAGAALGIVAGHGLAFAAAYYNPSLQSMVVPTAMLIPNIMDLIWCALGILAGAVAGILPASLAVRTDIAGLLARGAQA